MKYFKLFFSLAAVLLFLVPSESVAFDIVAKHLADLEVTFYLHEGALTPIESYTKVDATTVRVYSRNHGLANNDRIAINGRYYPGTYTVANKTNHTFEITATFENNEQGTAWAHSLNLTGYTGCESKVFDDAAGSNEMEDMDCTISDAAGGKMVIELTDTEVDILTVNSIYYWDLIKIQSDGTRDMLVSGKFYVKGRGATERTKGISTNLAVYDPAVMLTIVGGGSGGGSVSDTAYGVGWDNDTATAASRNAIYDKIETLAGGHDAVTLGADADTVLGLTSQQIDLDTQTANQVFAGPTAGGAADPAFRALVAADIPDISATYEPAGITESDISDLSHTTDTNLTQEEVEDFAGALITDGTGTHTRVTVTYQDLTGDIDIVVDDMNDDVPESGDFGNAADLEADGSLSVDTVAAAEMADADHGDVSWSAGVATVDNVDDDNVAFDDADSNWTATKIGPALEELDDVNGSGPNAADGKVDWSQLVSVPAGFADGTDATGAVGTDGIGTDELDDGASAAGTNKFVMIDNGDTTQFIYIAVPDCDNATTSKLLYDQTTQAITCGTDQTGAGGGDEVSIDGVASTNPDFTSDGDLDVIRCTGAGAPDASCGAAEDVIIRYNTGTIVNADINASAAIASSKLATDVIVEADVDTDIQTLALPASTTISAFGKTLVDDADAAAARTTLGAESDTHGPSHAVGGADSVFPADPNADRLLMWDDAPTGEHVYTTDIPPGTTIGGAAIQTGTDDDVPESGDFGAAADLDASGEVADDSHNHIYSNLDAFTEAQLYTILSDVSNFLQAGDTIDDDDVAFDDLDANWTATTIGAALEELDEANGGAPNQATGKVNWEQLTNVPAGFADGADAAGSGGVDEAFGSGWDGDTDAPEKDDVYDYMVKVAEQSKGMDIEDPASSETFILWKVPYDIVLTKMSCLLDPTDADTADSAIFYVRECDSSGDSCADNNAALTCLSSGSTKSTFADTQVDAGDYLFFHVGTVVEGGTLDLLNLQIDYRPAY